MQSGITISEPKFQEGDIIAIKLFSETLGNNFIAEVISYRLDHIGTMLDPIYIWFYKLRFIEGVLTQFPEHSLRLATDLERDFYNAKLNLLRVCKGVENHNERK